MGAAEEAAAGEVTDRKAWFHPSGPLLSALHQPPPSLRCVARALHLISPLDVVSASKTEPVERQRVEQVTEPCPTSFEKYKMGKRTGPHCIGQAPHPHHPPPTTHHPGMKERVVLELP